MSLIVEKTPLEGLRIIRPKIFRDPRGFFVESYNRSVFAAAGITTEFVQDNHSRSSRGTLRGLHYQSTPGQAKLIRCTSGTIWDVVVDIRPKSPTFGNNFGMELRPEDTAMLFIPIGFAHGFVVLSETADVQYKCSSVYNAATESGIRWNDPELAVPWPLQGLDPLLSERDQKAPTFAEYKAKI